MKHFLAVFCLTILACGFVYLPTIVEVQEQVYADHIAGHDKTNDQGQTGDDKPKDQGQTGANAPSFELKFLNPLKYKTVICLLYALFKIFMNIFAIVAGLYILYSGFRFVSAQGKPDKLKEARQNFWNVLIGTILILGSWAIVNVAINTINDLLEEDIAWIPSNSVCKEKAG